MKKILIADDEILVRVGLKSALDWEENGFIVVGEAKNGKEALAMFEEHSPDILITDISMPFMNGLEVIKVLKEKKPSLKIIILTHYNDFNYAQEAVELGVVQYILKSQLIPDNLLKILKKISKEMDYSSNISDSDSIQKENNVPIKKSIRDLEIYKIITTGKIESKEELKIMLQDYGVQFSFSSFIVAYALMPLEFIENNRYKDNLLYLNKVLENVCKQILIKGKFSVVTVIKDNKILYLINFNMDELENDEVLAEIVKLMISVKKNIKKFLDIQLSVGISSIGDCLTDIYRLYKEAKIAQEYNFFDNDKVFIFSKEMELEKGNIPVFDSNRLKKYMIDKNKTELNQYLDNIFKQLFTTKNIEYVRRIFIDLLNQAKLLYTQFNNESKQNISELDYGVFDQLYNFDLVKKYIFDIYYDLFLCYQNQQVKQYSHIVKKSINYIAQNYNKDISLSDAAEYVELSSSYLSFLFKKEKGINFSTFLTEFRIEKARELLVDSNKKMYEIAEQVGFDNPYYFSKLFKEITGMTCKEYRRNYYK